MTPNKYKGYTEWTPNFEEAAELYTTNSVKVELLENEYLIIRDYQTNEVNEIRKLKNGKLIKINRPSFKIRPDKKVNPEEKPEVADGKKKDRYKKPSKPQVIVPRNTEQQCAFDLLVDNDIGVKLITGIWGSGKSFLLVAAALQAIEEGQFEKIIWVRNNVRIKDTEDLGALPGSELEKLIPFLGPFIDHAGKGKVMKMIEHDQLIVEPLQSLRGRSFDNSIIMCSESENLTKEHIQLIIARAGEGTQVWFDGDTRQRDRASFEKSAGLEKLIDRLKGNKLFGYVHLVKSERSETAALADLLDEPEK